MRNNNVSAIHTVIVVSITIIAVLVNTTVRGLMAVSNAAGRRRANKRTQK